MARRFFPEKAGYTCLEKLIPSLLFISPGRAHLLDKGKECWYEFFV